MRGDITVIKKEAIQLGYLCCVELKNSQKQRKFEHHLSELGIAIPDTEQTKIEVVQEIISICMEIYLIQCTSSYFV